MNDLADLIDCGTFLGMPVRGWAIISDCGTFRYQLGRVWDESKGLVSFTLHNSSTADAKKNDATVRRLFTFAERLGKGGFIVTNPCAGRTMSPKVLRAMADPCGPDNLKWIEDAAEHADVLIVGWGAVHADLRKYVQRAIHALTSKGKPLWCLGKTKDGDPRHPLYIRSDKQLERWP